MAMEFLDDLDEKQSHIASIIIQKAKQSGVDPRLALSLAFRESSLRHGDFERNKEGAVTFKPTTGKAGEVGIMQIKPDTAKQYGFKPEELSGLEKNIEIGLKILKSNIQKFGDPVLAVAAYNAGDSHPFFTDPDKSPLPDSTKQYIKDIEKFGGFSSFTDSPAQPPVSNEGLPMMPEEEPSPPSEPTFKEQVEKRVPGAVGSVVGATTGTAIAAGRKARNATDLLKQLIESQIAAKQTPITGVNMPAAGMAGAAPEMGGSIATQPRAPLSAPIPSGGLDAGRMAKGQTGTMPYNYAKAAGLTDIEAMKALDMTKQAGGVHDLTSQRREGLQKIQQLFPTESYVENPRFGGLMTPDMGVGGGPRQSFVMQPPDPNAPTGQPPQSVLRELPPRMPVPTAPPPVSYSLLDEAIEKLGQIAKGGLHFVSSAPVAGGLGGYGAAMSGVEAYEREKAGDRPGAVIAGLGTLQALAAIPTGLTQAVGLGAGIASPLGLAVLDRMRKIKAEPKVEPSPQEMQRAQTPAFVYPNP